MEPKRGHTEGVFSPSGVLIAAVSSGSSFRYGDFDLDYLIQNRYKISFLPPDVMGRMCSNRLRTDSQMGKRCLFLARFGIEL
jgi:hypothetical protein